MKNFKSIVILAVVLLMTVCAKAQETVNVVRYNASTHSRETLCEARYYVKDGVLYVNKEFSYFGVVFTDADGTIVGEKSLVLNDAPNGWFSTRLSNNDFGKFKNYTISALVFRNCKYNQQSGVSQCYDGYAYNNVKSIPAWRGSSVLNETTKLIINTLK